MSETMLMLFRNDEKQFVSMKWLVLVVGCG